MTTVAYRRRTPEDEPLYRAMSGHLETFLEQLRATDRQLPRHVEQEMRAYLECGILAYGFLRVRCEDCGGSRIVAFSCKKRGFCLSWPAQQATAVLEQHQATRPGASFLNQNFPNPYNSETTIRFDLARPEEINLTVYNLAGQKVITLAQGIRQTGTHTLRWDGRDGVGRELASGVYLYQMRTGDIVRTRRMLLLK